MTFANQYSENNARVRRIEAATTLKHQYHGDVYNQSMQRLLAARAQSLVLPNATGFARLAGLIQEDAQSLRAALDLMEAKPSRETALASFIAYRDVIERWSPTPLTGGRKGRIVDWIAKEARLDRIAPRARSEKSTRAARSAALWLSRHPDIARAAPGAKYSPQSWRRACLHLSRDANRAHFYDKTKSLNCLYMAPHESGRLVKVGMSTLGDPEGRILNYTKTHGLLGFKAESVVTFPVYGDPYVAEASAKATLRERGFAVFEHSGPVELFAATPSEAHEVLSSASLAPRTQYSTKRRTSSELQEMISLSTDKSNPPR